MGPADAFEIDVDALNLRTEGAVEPRRRQGVTVRQVQATIAGVLLVCFSIACSTSDSIDDVSPSVDAGPVTPSDSGWFVGVEWAADAKPDGEVCFELPSESTEWTVPNTCWQPPFFDTWQRASFGSVAIVRGRRLDRDIADRRLRHRSPRGHPRRRSRPMDAEGTWSRGSDPVQLSMVRSGRDLLRAGRRDRGLFARAAGGGVPGGVAPQLADGRHQSQRAQPGQGGVRSAT